MAKIYLIPLDLNGNELRNFRLQMLAADPDPSEARIYYNSSAHRVRYHDGTDWITLESGSTDALTLQGQNAAYFLDRTNHNGQQPASSISDLEAVVLAYRLNQFAVPNGNVSFGGFHITNLADPQNPQDAATQAYVQAQIAGLVNGAPGVLDTLAEIAAALGDDPNLAATLSNQITAARDRANHTGTQLAATISDFAAAVAALIPAAGFAVDIGDNSATAIVVTHNLNTRDVVPRLRRNVAPYDFPEADYEATTVNTVTYRFATAPTANQYRAIITRAA